MAIESIEQQPEEERLLALEEELEGESLELGADRFRKRVQKAIETGQGSTAGAGTSLLANATEFLEGAIQYIIDEGALPSQGRRSAWAHAVVRTIKKFGNEPGTASTIAHITARTVIDNLLMPEHERSRCDQVALDVATYIVDELRYRRFRDTHPGLFNYRLKKLRSTNHYGHQRRAMNATMAYAGFETPDLSLDEKEKSNVGEVLVGLLLEMNSAETWKKPEGLADVWTGYEGKRKVRKLRPTETTLAWLATWNKAREFDRPRKMPMVVPPLPWTREEDGGYLFNQFGKYPMVKNVSAEHLRTIKRSVDPTVFKALNLIQATPWRINTEVLEVIEKIRALGREMAGIAASEREPEPPRPHDIDTNEEARRKWRDRAHDVHEREHLRKPRAAEDARILSVARRFVNETIYFPHNVDLTGRVYPIADVFSPQGGDFSRALLTFADAKPLGKRGSYWLAIHGANCLGKTPQGEKVSKMSFADRVAYVERHTQAICRAAKDPLAETWWVEADEPLQFYAFCCEWNRYVESGYSEEFVSGLPIYQDGSCNGLQHYSALLRDEIGGNAVNLVPSDWPQDIYQKVADNVLDKLADRAASDPLAAKWLESGVVDRKLTKKPTMTFAYGTKQWSQSNQIMDYLENHDEAKKLKALFTEHGSASGMGAAVSLMSELIWDALRETVAKAAECMDSLRDNARAIAKGTRGTRRKAARAGKCVEWTVPETNFHVRQEYFRYDDTEQGYTMFRGKPIRPRIYRRTDDIDFDKQSNSMAPNYIHSLDAAALHMTVARTSQVGIASFGVVHDNFATVAGDYDILAQQTRESFHLVHRGQLVEPESEEAIEQELDEREAEQETFRREWEEHGELSAQSLQRIQDRVTAKRGRARELPINALYRQLQAQMTPDELPSKRPALGHLDLDLVLKSPYFFA